MRAAQRVARICLYLLGIMISMSIISYLRQDKKVDNAPIVGFEIKRKCKGCGKDFVAKAFDCYYCSPPKYSQ